MVISNFPLTQVTAAQLKAIYPLTKMARIKEAVPHINETLKVYQIDTVYRIACFLGQVGVESGGLNLPRELWGAGPTVHQARYERDFTKPYEKTNERNKKAHDLGNSEVGDGFRFRGRGLIQTTGRKNYIAVGVELKQDFVGSENSQKLLEMYPWAALAAGYYWRSNNLNRLADFLDVRAITKKVNGGRMHLQERIDFTYKALNILAPMFDYDSHRYHEFYV